VPALTVKMAIIKNIAFESTYISFIHSQNGHLWCLMMIWMSTLKALMQIQSLFFFLNYNKIMTTAARYNANKIYNYFICCCNKCCQAIKIWI